MNILDLSGSHVEIGEQYGRILKGNFTPPPASQERIRFSKECERLTEQHAPGLVEELVSLSSEAGLDEDLVKAFVLTLGLEPGCTVFALSDEETVIDGPVVARNYDWDVEFEEYFTPARISPDKEYSCLCFSDHFVGVYGGVNEEGLSVAVTAIPAYTGKPRPGVRTNVALRWILNNLGSTDEAVEWLLGTPRMWAQNYIVADKDGRLARVETAPERSRAEYSEEFILSTNHYHDPEMRSLESKSFDFTNTHTRQRRVEKWYREGRPGISLDDIKRVLSDRDVGVCNSYAVEGRIGGTIWSWIGELRHGTVHVSPGPPCMNDYVEVKV